MTDKQSPEEILDVNRKWLPPSPHVEKVLEMVEQGAAFIEKRGHHEPPLVMFEDGGVIELPKVRYEETYRGMQLVSSDEASSDGVTRFRDVCGCVDHIKGTLQDHPEQVQLDPQIFDQLLDHALYMIDRMSKRQKVYAQFAADVITACAKLPTPPDPAMASSAAEDVRHVASNQERCLREYKDLAMKINAIYREIRGARRWEEEC